MLAKKGTDLLTYRSSIPAISSAVIASGAHAPYTLHPQPLINCLWRPRGTLVMFGTVGSPACFTLCTLHAAALSLFSLLHTLNQSTARPKDYLLPICQRLRLPYSDESPRPPCLPSSFVLGSRCPFLGLEVCACSRPSSTTLSPSFLFFRLPFSPLPPHYHPPPCIPPRRRQYASRREVTSRRRHPAYSASTSTRNLIQLQDRTPYTPECRKDSIALCRLGRRH